MKTTLFCRVRRPRRTGLKISRQARNDGQGNALQRRKKKEERKKKNGGEAMLRIL